MRRRHFLQLTASAAAVAMAGHTYALCSSACRCSLRIAQVSFELPIGKVVHATVVALDRDPVPSRAAIDALAQTMAKPIEPYAPFSASAGSVPEPDQVIEMLLEKKLDTRDGSYHWIVNGRPFVDSEPLYLHPGQRYRLRMLNATGWPHPVHLQRHNFELARIHQIPVSGIFKNTIRLERYNVVEADVVVSHPGPADL
jgi:hypothetical protein